MLGVHLQPGQNLLRKNPKSLLHPFALEIKKVWGHMFKICQKPFKGYSKALKSNNIDGSNLFCWSLNKKRAKQISQGLTFLLANLPSHSNLKKKHKKKDSLYFHLNEVQLTSDEYQRWRSWSCTFSSFTHPPANSVEGWPGKKTCWPIFKFKRSSCWSLYVLISWVKSQESWPDQYLLISWPTYWPGCKPQQLQHSSWCKLFDS